MSFTISGAARKGSVLEQQGWHMKKNPLALSVYRTIKAANDDGSSVISQAVQLGSWQTPAAARSGWDPFEVWRTRIRPSAGHDPRGKR